MNLKKIGTKNVATLLSGSTIKEAAKLMREAHVGDVVVLHRNDSDSARKPIGILTDRDIVVSIVAFGIDPDDAIVDDVMSPVLITAKANESFYQVLNLMKENGIKRVPFVNAEGILEGIITADDVIATLAIELGDIANISERRKYIEESRRRKLA